MFKKGWFECDGDYYRVINGQSDKRCEVYGLFKSTEADACFGLVFKDVTPVDFNVMFSSANYDLTQADVSEIKARVNQINEMANYALTGEMTQVVEDKKSVDCQEVM